MDINYSSDVLDLDFRVGNGVSFTVEHGRLSLMAFVEMPVGLSINGISIEERGNEIWLSVLTQGIAENASLNQRRITAVIEPIDNAWQGDVKIIVKQPN